VFPFHFLACLFNVYNNFRLVSKTIVFFFGALDENFHSSCVLCASMVAQESCVFVNFYFSSNRLLSVMICGNS
jgi:hypothetical protein